MSLPNDPSSVLRSLIVLVCVLSAQLVLAADSPQAVESFRLLTAEPGVTRVDFDELRAALPRLAAVPGDRVSLAASGQQQPVWFEDGDGDGWFGPGDWLEFVAPRLGQDGRHYNDSNRSNVLQLRLGAPGGWIGTTATAVSGAETPGEPVGPRRAVHLEEDRMMVRLSERQLTGGWDSDLWFWEKLTHLGLRSFVASIDLSDLSDLSDLETAERASPGSGIVFRAAVRALNQSQSALTGGLPAHRLQLSIDGQPIGGVSWEGTQSRVVSFEVPPEAVAVGPVEIRLDVPRRVPEGLDEPIVDVVMVNWVEVEYRAAVDLPSSPRHELIVDRADVSVRDVEPITAYSRDGWRRVSADGHLRFERAQAQPIHVVSGTELLRVEQVEHDVSAGLRSTDRQADYLMIVHPRLIGATQRLANFHRGRGLNVELVDVQDVYDEFSHGLVDIAGIRDFVRYTQEAWLEPRPRFVLLVGDSSWDIKSEEIEDQRYANYSNRELALRSGDFAYQRATRYDATELAAAAHRNLVPTAMYASSQGHAASDNYFVAVQGDDWYPDLAIGRFPVATPEEVKAIVDKTIRYVEQPEVGPWRSEVLWITNEQMNFQRRTDRFAADALTEGFGAAKVYPAPEEKDNEQHQRRLQDELNDGKLLVHFLGHGGRFIWRTGPPDIKKNHDLFTLDHVEELEPTSRLPLVLSMTCFSAPFDHPDADSIGEKFLRVPERGAVAVLAASWRNSPSSVFSDALVRELTRPGAAIGAAIQAAKRLVRGRDLIETYNLLGDPAIPLALPTLRLESERTGSRVTVNVPHQGFEGSARLRWTDSVGDVLMEEEFVLVGESFSIQRPDSLAERDDLRLQVYAWSEAESVDGIVTVDFSAGEPAQAETKRASARR